MENQNGALSCPKSEIIDIFITNLGKYNEGELVGEWLSLPTTKEELQACFMRIGIDGINYEEFFITDSQSIISGLSDVINEYENLNELNYLAHKIDYLIKDEISHYEAIIDAGFCNSSIKELINLTDNLDCYDYLNGIFDASDLGYYWIEDSGCYDLSSLGNLSCYFDYEKFGRDILIEQNGTFTCNGYIYANDESFYEEYDGKSVPEEYKII